METGRTVILLNLESLYESLYDALNQVWMGEKIFFQLIFLVKVQHTLVMLKKA